MTHPARARISLRVSTYLWTGAERRKELLEFLREYRDTIDEVAFFTSFTHPPLPLDVIRERARLLAEVIPQFRALGLAAGINHLSTMGHLDENLENSLREPWQHLVDISGRESPSCYCVADPSMRAYVRDAYTALAEARPDFIWVDDDVRLESHPPAIAFACFCERCLARFGEESGRTWSRESLRQAFNAGSVAERLGLRREWVRHNERYIAGLLASIREAVDGVDPRIALGLMTGEIAYSGYGETAWAEALAGPRGIEVKWRPGGGFYTDASPGELLGKAHGIGRQTSFLPTAVADIQSEHENFPYQPMKKSARIFAAEVGAYIGAGCTGTALNCMGISADPMDEFHPYFAVVRRHRGLYDAMVRAFGRSPCEGIWQALAPDYFACAAPEGDWFSGAPWGGGLWAANELAEIGVPVAYGREGAAVTLLRDEACLQFTPEELRKVLAGGVLLDGPALQRLNEMGFAEHTGFAVREKKEKDTTEVFTPDPLNGRFAGWRRDCRPSFWPETSYLLEPLTPRSRVIAEVEDFTPRRYGAVAGVFENALGGRVAALGYYPWRSLQSLAKTSQMKALCRWLSGDALPAYVASYHKTALWCRRDPQNRPAMLVMNASLDTAEDLRLHVRGVRGLRLRRAGGQTEVLHDAGGDAVYGTFVIGHIEPWELVLAVKEE